MSFRYVNPPVPPLGAVARVLVRFSFGKAFYFAYFCEIYLKIIMKNILILLLVIFCSCLSYKKRYITDVLSFDDLLEIFKADENTRKEILDYRGYKIIPNNDTKGITFSKKHKPCKSDLIYFHTLSKSMEYYLQSDEYKIHYDSIKKEVESKGFLYLTTQKIDEGFIEIYGDTITNKIGLYFSDLPVSKNNPCQVKNTSIRFFNREQ